VAAVLALGGNVLITIHKARLQMKTAVVTTESAEVLYGPFDSATKFFTLHEGEKVLITSQKNGWRKIRRADGKKGWVKNGGIERVRR
jgi:SH3-like domain-containing protein